jgi:hypothetical protein
LGSAQSLRCQTQQLVPARNRKGAAHDSSPTSPFVDCR